jgi:hypothetical protein
MIRQPVFYDKVGNHINNPNGRNWAEIGDHVVGVQDIRARLGTFTTPWGAKSNVLNSTPPVRAVEDRLSNLLDRRACELLTDQRRIAVLWSGGIDSTCVLASLIKNTNNLSQLVVYCNSKSVEENPEFYKNFLVGKIECRETDSLDVTDDFLKSHMLLHGDPGDSIYGASVPHWQHLIQDNRHLLPWRSNLNLISEGIDIFRSRPAMSHVPLNPGFSSWYANKVGNNIEEVKTYEINNIVDFWWWHYFNLKWDFSMLRPFYGLRKNRRAAVSQESLKSFIHTTFYNTEYFQNWSYTNLPKLFVGYPDKHKLEAKQYIFELDKDELYFQNKRRKESAYGGPLQYPTYLDKNAKSYFLTDPGVTEALIELLEQYTG